MNMEVARYRVHCNVQMSIKGRHHAFESLVQQYLVSVGQSYNGRAA